MEPRLCGCKSDLRARWRLTHVCDDDVSPRTSAHMEWVAFCRFLTLSRVVLILTSNFWTEWKFCSILLLVFCRSRRSNLMKWISLPTPPYILPFLHPVCHVTHDPQTVASAHDFVSDFFWQLLKILQIGWYQIKLSPIQTYRGVSRDHHRRKLLKLDRFSDTVSTSITQASFLSPHPRTFHFDHAKTPTGKIEKRPYRSSLSNTF